jgi:DNA damage-inducible protein 1
MLKSHRACVDLDKNCLRIQGQEIPFLAEHELPDKAKHYSLPPPSEEEEAQSSAQPNQPIPAPSGSHFPGSGNTLGSVAVPQQREQFSEEKISALTNLGASREQAVQLLREANGNVDMAASLLFN